RKRKEATAVIEATAAIGYVAREEIRWTEGREKNGRRRVEAQVPPLNDGNSAYFVQSNAVENESYQNSPKNSSRQRSNEDNQATTVMEATTAVRSAELRPPQWVSWQQFPILATYGRINKRGEPQRQAPKSTVPDR
ncbi:hypothetical protein S245_043001, partial [Arachis hypogaea]